MKSQELIQRILAGNSDTNVRFRDIRKLLFDLQFVERVKGSHHIYTRIDIDEIINLQATSEHMAKPYQVKQVREIIKKYDLAQERD